ncbi:hypothetical protein N866_07385 [Actinotalea ferrariae CF5-4]|uniref:DUF2252 domain-containing protein n=1 Tax=Actinotalea ferrariae CF5-4 TaxID=948458 RepID=A0A021VN27_9CELL|nr:DUF2252 domain-containing protein [Actinotalea ferrariae]EYR62566.1 hypothetical protein N866_07385 [Actinotalea ferrariae CF5-4]
MSSDEQRSGQIVDVLSDAFRDLIDADARAFRRKFRAMAADPFAFYRGTACLFYVDLVGTEDRWADERTGRVWIQGDLHAENFGTSMDGHGVLVFDVNDYDEAYLAPFTWDLRRMAASLAVLGWTKALPDAVIRRLIEVYLRAYLDQVHHFVESDRDHEWSLRLGTARGAVHDALLEAQLKTRVGLLDEVTVIEDYRRRFRESPHLRVLEDEERDAGVRAYEAYVETLPGSKRLGSLTYELKDVVGASGFGIGSAGLQAYNLLVEGHTQALENDVVLSMKQGAVPAAGRVAPDEEAERYFEHQGHRTAVSQRTLQAHPDPWLGWTRMEGGPQDGVGFVVKELSPYEADLDWEALSEPDELAEVLEQLGRATAKVHCVSDVDSPDVPLVDFQTEDAIADVVSGAEDELVEDVVEFGMTYGERARADHALFVDAFRNGRFEHVDPEAG